MNWATSSSASTGLRFYFAAFLIVEAADEAHLGEELLGRIRREVEHGILLANLCGDHSAVLSLAERIFIPAAPWLPRATGEKQGIENVD
jgi:hypothetical protein